VIALAAGLTSARSRLACIGGRFDDYNWSLCTKPSFRLKTIKKLVNLARGE
jgi:hypothetical protein